MKVKEPVEIFPVGKSFEVNPHLAIKKPSCLGSDRESYKKLIE